MTNDFDMTQPSSGTQMKINSLTIKGLFGHFDHHIALNEGNVTIITAPNGYGKTVCLKIFDAIFNRRLSYFCDLHFTKIKINTSLGTLTILKDMSSDPTSIHLSHSETDSPHFYQKNGYELRARGLPMHAIETNIPFLTRVGARDWEDDRTGKVYSLEEVLENFNEYLPDEYSSRAYPNWLKEFMDSTKAHFIQDQRLIQRTAVREHSRRTNYVDTIEKYAAELSDLIKQSGFKSSRVSQQLDTTFPERLLRKDLFFQPLDAETIAIELSKLQEKRAELSKFDLLSSSHDLPALSIASEIQTEDLKVLTLYVNDTKEKLSSYDDIYRKIRLFSRILNNKRLSFKKVFINSESGFQFITDNDRLLNLTQLSSGEQHQVVLLYELIFKTERNLLVLIDEPEISLHVAWQKQFLRDLKEILEIQSMPVIIATHSPQIIDNNWHLVNDLDEGAFA